MISPYSLSRPGGVQGQVLGLTKELRKLGVDVRVLGPCDGPPPAPGATAAAPRANGPTTGPGPPSAAGKVGDPATIEALRTVRPDVVHLHEPAVPGPTITALIGFQGPMIGTFHIAGEMSRTYLKPALRGAMGRLRMRVAVSGAARDHATAFYGGEYRVLWNGIDQSLHRDVDPFPSQRPAVLFVGRHEERKGLGVLLDAWRDIEREATLWVVGDGPQSADLRGRGVPGVEWLGPLSDADLAARFAGATVFCAPSTGGESFGIVLLEAMVARLPIVASAIGGYSDVARHDVEALLVPPCDPGALRDALRRTLDEAALRERLVEAGVERAAEFSMRGLAEAYALLYEECLGERRTRRRAR